MKATITNLLGEYERVSLPKPLYDNEDHHREQDTTGVWFTGLYYGPRTKRMVLRTDSNWDAGNGSVVGITYDEISRGEFLRMCDQLGVEVPSDIDDDAKDL